MIELIIAIFFIVLFAKIIFSVPKAHEDEKTEKKGERKAEKYPAYATNASYDEVKGKISTYVGKKYGNVHWSFIKAYLGTNVIKESLIGIIVYKDGKEIKEGITLNMLEDFVFSQQKSTKVFADEKAKKRNVQQEKKEKLSNEEIFSNWLSIYDARLEEMKKTGIIFIPKEDLPPLSLSMISDFFMIDGSYKSAIKRDGGLVLEEEDYDLDIE